MSLFMEIFAYQFYFKITLSFLKDFFFKKKKKKGCPQVDLEVSAPGKPYWLAFDCYFLRN